MKLLPLSLVLLLAFGCSSDRVIQTDFSSLTVSPERYSGRRVSIEGVLAIGFEAMIFEDVADAKPSDIWFDYADLPRTELKRRGFDRLDKAFAESPEKGDSKLQRLVHVHVVGRFMHASRENNGFGHLGAFRSRLIIEEVLEASPFTKRPNQ